VRGEAFSLDSRKRRASSSERATTWQAGCDAAVRVERSGRRGRVVWCSGGGGGGGGERDGEGGWGDNFWRWARAEVEEVFAALLCRQANATPGRAGGIVQGKWCWSCGRTIETRPLPDLRAHCHSRAGPHRNQTRTESARAQELLESVWRRVRACRLWMSAARLACAHDSGNATRRPCVLCF
jgi:hypothetical protein